MSGIQPAVEDLENLDIDTGEDEAPRLLLAAVSSVADNLDLGPGIGHDPISSPAGT